MDQNIPDNSQQDTQLIGAVPVRQSPEMTFGKTLLASGLGFISASIFLILVAGFIVVMLVGSIASSTEQESIVLDSSVLHLNLSGSTPEHTASYDFASVFSGSSAYTFLDLITSIDHAGTDDRIEGIWLEFKGYGASTAQYEELIAALGRFRESGKFVYAFADTDGYSEGEYLVATAADSVFLHKSAGIELNGLYVMLEFYKPLMEKLNIEPIVVRAGSYKAAVEPFTRSEASEEFRQSTADILSGMHSYLRRTIAEHRGLAQDEIDSIMAKSPYVLARDAVSLGLVDRVLYDEEVEEVLTGQLDEGREWVSAVSIKEYASYVRRERRDRASDAVGVIYAHGAITTGRSGKSANPLMGGTQVGSESFLEDLREARENESVKAIVLRVDSPGGGLPPSVEMWHEISMTAAEKPIVVSMGGTAASGGYYIAAPATEIFADETTVTGSIGVFALAFNLEGLYEESIGIRTEVIKTGPHADLLSLMRDLTPEEIAFAEAEIDTAYTQFLDVVAEGRDLSREVARTHAEGRVWTGKQALDRGLVDEIGGLYEAMNRAAELADLEEYSIKVIPRPLDQVEQIVSMIEEFSAMSRVAEPLKISALRTELESELRSMSGMQVRFYGWKGVK